jgi:hypothetical protein
VSAGVSAGEHLSGDVTWHVSDGAALGGAHGARECASE